MRILATLIAADAGRATVCGYDMARDAQKVRQNTGLGPATREDMWGVVRSLVDERSTVLLITKYLEEADALADDTSVIDHGQVIAQGTPDQLKRVVGGQTLTVRTTQDDRTHDAARVLADVTGTELRRAALKLAQGTEAPHF